MTFAAKIADAWTVLPVGQRVVVNDIAVEWATLMAMPTSEREAFGAYEVPDPVTPAGKIEVTRELAGATRPAWFCTYTDAPPVVEPVPTSVSSAQACLILSEDGLLKQVEALVTEMPEAVQIWFARANTWERNNPYVMGIGLELDLTEEAMDEMFRRAARRL